MEQTPLLTLRQFCHIILLVSAFTYEDSTWCSPSHLWVQQKRQLPYVFVTFPNIWLVCDSKFSSSCVSLYRILLTGGEARKRIWKSIQCIATTHTRDMPYSAWRRTSAIWKVRIQMRLVDLSFSPFCWARTSLCLQKHLAYTIASIMNCNHSARPSPRILRLNVRFRINKRLNGRLVSIITCYH